MKDIKFREICLDSTVRLSLVRNQFLHNLLIFEEAQATSCKFILNNKLFRTVLIQFKRR